MVRMSVRVYCIATALRGAAIQRRARATFPAAAAAAAAAAFARHPSPLATATAALGYTPWVFSLNQIYAHLFPRHHLFFFHSSSPFIYYSYICTLRYYLCITSWFNRFLTMKKIGYSSFDIHWSKSISMSNK